MRDFTGTGVRNAGHGLAKRLYSTDGFNQQCNYRAHLISRKEDREGR